MSKHVVLGVSGSIAAFKAAALASSLVGDGAEVRVILTAGGARFVTPLTFEAITGNPVGTQVWDEQPRTSRMGHVDIGRWADVLVVAPASANTITRLALGIADDLLGAVALSSDAPLLLAPAMESGMYEHPAIQAHLDTLMSRGAQIMGPEVGRLASGREGIGRMSDPGSILVLINEMIATNLDFAGRRVLVTAGPTFEAIDQVRFIGNRSSGKMGFAIAREAMRRGARVTLIVGPTALAPPPGAEVVRVETSQEMERAVMGNVADVDVVVMAAAVADFRPEEPRAGKLRRGSGLTIGLVPTPDIAAEAALAAPEAIHVGFALEPHDLVSAARSKLERKGQDLVIGNLISADHNPFGSDTNRVILVRRQGESALPEMSKQQVAVRILDEVSVLVREKRPST